MKSLAERILALVPRASGGLSLLAAMKSLGQDREHVRAAFEGLDKVGRVHLFRRGRGGAPYLAAADSDILACRVCRREYVRGPKSKRITCSRSCAVSLSWTNEGARASRIDGIKKDRAGPEAKARLAAHNERRWSKPEEHQKLADQNRRAWKDPEKAAIRAAKIRINHQTPEFRTHLSKCKTEQWADPEMRKKMTDAVNASEAVKNYRANFGEFLKKRWADPACREKMTAANRERNRVKSEKARAL